MKVFWHKQRGSAAVETVLVLPLVLYLFIGVVQFGMFINTQLIANECAREISRSIALMGQEHPDTVNNIIQAYFGTEGGGYIYGGDEDSIDIEIYSEDVEVNGYELQELTSHAVHIRYACPLFIPGADYFIGGDDDAFAGIEESYFLVDGEAVFFEEVMEIWQTTSW